MNPVDFAKKGDLEYFKNIIEIDTLQNFKDEEGYSLLSIAAKELHVECCKDILRRCPSLLYHQTNDGNTVLHVTLLSYERSTPDEMLKVFIGAEEDIKRSEEILQSGDLLFMVNHRGETALHQAVRSRNKEAVKLLIQADTRKMLLEMVDRDKNTALHLAVEDVMSGIAQLLIKPYPSHKIGMNKDRKTPFLVIVQESKYSHSIGGRAAEILEKMLRKDPKQAKAHIGSRGWTALHHAASDDNTNAIHILLEYCPDCCTVVDYVGRNFLHIAAEQGCIYVVRQVLALDTIPSAVFNLQNKHGNSPLHTAALKDNENLTKCLLYDNRVSTATTNYNNQKVLDAISFEYDRVRAGVFGRKEMSQKMMKEQGEFDLVVSALIAAVTFTVGIAIPGGYFSDGPSQGMAVLSKSASFFAFVISNNFALMFSLYAVFSHFCVRRLLTIEDIIYQLNVATRCTFGAIFAMMVAFITGSYIVLASSRVLSITACVQCCCFFIFAANAMRRMVPSHVIFWKKNKEAPPSSNSIETPSSSNSLETV